jgi:dynein heavy chain
MLSALGPPGGGRSFITPRMVRHFNQIAYTELNLGTAYEIFSALVAFFFNKYPEDVRATIGNFVN